MLYTILSIWHINIYCDFFTFIGFIFTSLIIIYNYFFCIIILSINAYFSDYLYDFNIIAIFVFILNISCDWYFYQYISHYVAYESMDLEYQSLFLHIYTFTYLYIFNHLYKRVYIETYTHIWFVVLLNYFLTYLFRKSNLFFLVWQKSIFNKKFK